MAEHKLVTEPHPLGHACKAWRTNLNARDICLDAPSTMFIFLLSESPISIGFGDRTDQMRSSCQTARLKSQLQAVGSKPKYLKQANRLF